jgi:hypothetical protein
METNLKAPGDLSMSDDNKVVPFGKYRGQPVELLLADQKYLEWLRTQPWFEERYRDIYNVVINYGSEPQDSPEHNRLQVLFLDDNFCLAFAKIATNLNCNANSLSDRFFEIRGLDVFLEIDGKGFGIEIKPSVGDDYPSVLRQMINIRQNIRRPNYFDELSGRYSFPQFILFLETYNGIGATREQFIQIFKDRDIQVVFLEDVYQAL